MCLHSGGAGIRIFGTGNFVVKNTLFGNALQLTSTQSGNFIGPRVSVNAVYGRDDSWANLLGN